MPRAVLIVAIVVLPLIGARAHAQLEPTPPRPGRRDVSTIQSGTHRMVVDPKGDGVDLGACSAVTRRRDLRPSTDDRLLAVDVVDAAKVGFRVTGRAGTLGRAAPFGDALRITVPKGVTHETSDAWQMFVLFDTNSDGLLDTTDLVWTSLRLARDANGNGVIDDAELEPLTSIDVVRFGPRLPTRTERDVHGSELSFGVFAKKDGTAGRMADVLFAGCDPPKGR